MAVCCFNIIIIIVTFIVVVMENSHTVTSHKAFADFAIQGINSYNDKK